MVLFFIGGSLGSMLGTFGWSVAKWNGVSAITCALLLLALTYVPDPAAVIREVSRILKPSGRAVIVDLLPHDREDFRIEMGQQRNGISEDQVRQLFAEASMDNVKYRSLAPETGVMGPSLFLATARAI